MKRLGYNENSQRFTIVIDSDIEYDITSGEVVTIRYKDLVLKSNVEWDNDKGSYYMVKYRELPLAAFVGCNAELE